MDHDLGAEYRQVGDALGFGLDELRRIAAKGIESTWLDASDRAALAREFDAALPTTSTRTPHIT